MTVRNFFPPPAGKTGNRAGHALSPGTDHCCRIISVVCATGKFAIKIRNQWSRTFSIRNRSFDRGSNGGSFFRTDMSEVQKGTHRSTIHLFSRFPPNWHWRLMFFPRFLGWDSNGQRLWTFLEWIKYLRFLDNFGIRGNHQFLGKGSPRDKAFSKSASLHSLTFPAHSWGLMWEANRCVYVFVCTSLFPTSSVFRPRLGCGSSATLWAQDRGRTCWLFWLHLTNHDLYPVCYFVLWYKIEADNHLSHDDVFLPVYSKTQLPAMIPDHPKHLPM